MTTGRKKAVRITQAPHDWQLIAEDVELASALLAGAGRAALAGRLRHYAALVRTALRDARDETAVGSNAEA